MILLLNSCATGDKYQSGKPFEVLDKDIYNELQQKYKFIGDFQDGTSVVLDSCYGLIDTKGNEILPCIYDTISDLTNKCRIICKNKKYGTVNIDGEININCDYDDYKLSENDYLAFKCIVKKKWFANYTNEI